MLYGTRLDLQIGFYTTYVPLTYGLMIGAYAGYFGGTLDTILMRFTDTAMAFPFIVLIIFILAKIFILQFFWSLGQCMQD